MQTEKLVQLEPYKGPAPDLTTLEGRNALALQIKNDFDEYAKLAYSDGPRFHLGASEIGHKCSRYLWYKFRWMFKEEIKDAGRVYRLFNRGHREESRFREWLQGIGCPDTDSEEKQIKLSECEGHFGGSRDGLVYLTRYGVAFPILTEYKTNGTGRGFDALSEGVQVAKPIHWAQMCVYGYSFGLQYGLYLNINKNDDSMHVEVVELDWELGKLMIEKGRAIIVATEPPARISSSPEWYECKYCSANRICHHKGVIQQNCRSCSFAKPVADANWFCNKWASNIPKEAIPDGCSEWSGLAQ
jgi:hypothetical protein